jgi:hypothetical protein
LAPSPELLLPSFPARIWRSRVPPARARGGGSRPRGPGGGPLLPPLTVTTLPPCPLSSRRRLLHGTGEEGGYGGRPPWRAQLQPSSARSGPPRQRTAGRLAATSSTFARGAVARGFCAGVLHDGEAAASSAPRRKTRRSAPLLVPPVRGKNARTQRHRANLSRSVPIAHTGANNLILTIPTLHLLSSWFKRNNLT